MFRRLLIQSGIALSVVALGATGLAAGPAAAIPCVAPDTCPDVSPSTVTAGSSDPVTVEFHLPSGRTDRGLVEVGFASFDNSLGADEQGVLSVSGATVTCTFTDASTIHWTSSDLASAITFTSTCWTYHAKVPFDIGVPGVYFQVAFNGGSLSPGEFVTVVTGPGTLRAPVTPGPYEVDAFVDAGDFGSTSITVSADSSPSSTSAPWHTLTFDGNGGTCATTKLTAPTTSWIKTPTDCSKTGATLLGWSTSPAFPSTRAQQQVRFGWGAIDETSGGVRMIFIPSGRSTAVSGDNTLYAIWG